MTPIELLKKGAAIKAEAEELKRRKEKAEQDARKAAYVPIIKAFEELRDAGATFASGHKFYWIVAASLDIHADERTAVFTWFDGTCYKVSCHSYSDVFKTDFATPTELLEWLIPYMAQKGWVKL